MLRCLPLLKACNQQVDYVDKRHCNLFSVPDDVLRYAATLEELMLDANQIRELPRVRLFVCLSLTRLLALSRCRSWANLREWQGSHAPFPNSNNNNNNNNNKQICIAP